MKTIASTVLTATLLATLGGCVYEPAYVRHDGYRGSVYYSSRYDDRPYVYYDDGYWPGYYGYGYPSIGWGVWYHGAHHGRHHGHRRDDAHGHHRH
ncbi:hypothetical protein [Dokdonella sp.]|uniref:hypothetical protein n=1 Tax=Dokdonella sp. TaxID=2291710 RepID=UPI002F428093